MQVGLQLVTDPGPHAAGDKPLGSGEGHGLLDEYPGEPEAGDLLEAVELVDVLHRLTRRALAEVVERADDDRAPVSRSSNAPISAPSVYCTRASSGTTPSGRTLTTWLSA